MALPYYLLVHRKAYRATISRPTSEKADGKIAINIRCTVGGELRLALGKRDKGRVYHPEFVLSEEQLTALEKGERITVVPPKGWEEFATKLQSLSQRCIATALDAYKKAGWRYGGRRGSRHFFWKGRISDITSSIKSQRSLMEEGFRLLYPKGLNTAAN